MTSLTRQPAAPQPAAVRQTLRAAALGAEAELSHLTRELVRIDSQTPPSDTRQAARMAGEYLQAIPGIEVIRHSSLHPVENIVAVLRGGGPGPRLILSGHLDTYPIGTASAWTFDPFGGEVVDGRLYGRGSADMKGGIAASLVAFRLLAQQRDGFCGEVVLALAGDEESMGELGTQALIDEVPACRGDAVIVPDVGSPQIIRCGEKGMIWLSLNATGQAAHGAHVHRGSNAIDELVGAIAKLRSLEHFRSPEDHPAVLQMAAAHDISEPLGGAGERDVMSRVTVNVGTISGGTSPNLVPNNAQAEIDIRLPLGVEPAFIENEIQRLLGDLENIRWSVSRRYGATWSPVEEPIVRTALAAASDVLQRPTVANMRVGASDARLWRRAGMPTIVCGLTPYNLGAPDEHLVVEELPLLTAILALTTFDFLNRNVRSNVES